MLDNCKYLGITIFKVIIVYCTDKSSKQNDSSQSERKEHVGFSSSVSFVAQGYAIRETRGFRPDFINLQYLCLVQTYMSFLLLHTCYTASGDIFILSLFLSLFPLISLSSLLYGSCFPSFFSRRRNGFVHIRLSHVKIFHKHKNRISSLPKSF